MRTGISITVTPADRLRLEALVRDRNAPQKQVWRTEIVLLSADGAGTSEIKRRTGKSKTCVWRWQERFALEGFEGLLRDKTRPSRIAPLGAEVAARVVALTQTDPSAAATHWTTTMMAKAAGISASSVQRIWRAHGLQPHRVRQFKLSNDPNFVDKVHDVVGLYVDPPEQAIVLSVDEKSQIQALDRTQPGMPLKKGRAATMTHDYKRNGTTTLFAAFDVLEGKVIGRCMQKHRHQEFIRFLNQIEAQVPTNKAVHVILDNYATHKHPKVRKWLDRHPRFTFHFTPTSSSWLNAVEGFFAKLSKRRLKRGVFRSVRELKAAINRFLVETNNDPKPFTWTADPDQIIAAVRRGTAPWTRSVDPGVAPDTLEGRVSGGGPTRRIDPSGAGRRRGSPYLFFEDTGASGRPRVKRNWKAKIHYGVPECGCRLNSCREAQQNSFPTRSSSKRCFRPPTHSTSLTSRDFS
jgi:transposase